ncbi:MAG: hypothetical protein ACT4OM_07445 [Actinomycetota bacterium]
MMRKLWCLFALMLVLIPACSTQDDPEDLTIDASDPAQGSSVSVDPNAVLNHLKAAGLPVGRVDAYNAENDPFKLAGRPDRYIAKVVFADTRHNAEPCQKIEVLPWDECGGTIEVFASAGDLSKWKAAIVLAREGTPNAPPEYRYEKDLSLLRLGHVLTPEQAKAYEAAYLNFPG